MPTFRLTDRQWARYHRGIAGEVTRRLAARREALILEHLGMVPGIARQVAQILRHTIPQLDMGDLEQDGAVGLLQAADRYRSEDGPFAPYAYFRVRGAILDAHKRQSWHEHQPCQLHYQFLDDEIDYLADPAPGPHELAAATERRRRLRRAIERLLSDDEQSVLEEALAGRLAAAIAADRGHSSNWARVRLRAAREKVTASLAS